jgi:magnesium transporter
MKNPLIVPELLELLEANDRETLEEIVHAIHPARLAEFVAALKDEDLWRFLSAIPKKAAAAIFSNLDLDRQVELATGANRQAMARLLEELPHDDRADLVKNLDPSVADQILPLVAKADREDIRRLASFEEGTAGALMSSDYATLHPDMTIEQALAQIRLQAPSKETIYYIYVTDEQNRLVGFVSLKDLILSRPDQKVRDIMHEDVITAELNEDQEIVARKIEKYDLIAIPVINAERQLVGIVTHDDAMDVIRQEQQEDVEKLMAISGEHRAGEYLRTPSLQHFRNRVGWVLILGILGLFSGFIVQQFETLLMSFAILAAFMPMLADTGGNTGSQSATLVVRALALGEVRPADFFRVIVKELKVSLLLAAVLSVVAFLRVWLYYLASKTPPPVTVVRMGATVSLALGIQVVSATLLGAILPLLAARFKWDPAVVASPALTTLVDITGLFLFFTVARVLLPI